MSAPAHWGIVNLLDVCTLNPRYRLPTGDAKVDYVDYSGIDDAVGEITSREMRLLAEVPKGASTFRKGDVLFAGVTAEHWKSALVGELTHGLGMGPQLHVMRPGPELSAGYLWHIFQQPWLRQQAARMNTSTRSQPTLSHSFFRNMRIVLPPMDEQLYIVDWLEQASIRPYRDALHRVWQLKETLAARLMLPSTQALEPGWTLFNLGDICRINPKEDALALTPVHDTAEVVFFSGHDLLSDELTTTLVRYHDLPNSVRVVQAGDLLLGAAHDKTAYARVVVVSDYDRPMFVPRTLTVLRPEKAVSSQYLASLLQLPWLHTQARSQTSGRFQSAKDVAMLGLMKLALPQPAEQRRIVTILGEVPVQPIQNALLKSRVLYHSLAREAFNGALSKRWNAPSPTNSTNTLSTSDDASESSEAGPLLLGSFKHSYRTSITGSLSKFQRLVWRALRMQAQALIVDDPDSFDSFCSCPSLVPLRDVVSPNQVRRTLDQIAALGLVQKMSLPPRGKGDASPYLVAFRAYRQTANGRVDEDTAFQDSRMLRGSILETDLGL